jgi:hypothetical protein
MSDPPTPLYVNFSPLPFWGGVPYFGMPSSLTTFPSFSTVTAGFPIFLSFVTLACFVALCTTIMTIPLSELPVNDFPDAADGGLVQSLAGCPASPQL